MPTQQSLKKVLVHVGDQHRYQYLVIGLLCALFLMDSFLLLSQTIYLMNPSFNCKGEPNLVDEKQACPKLEDCTISNDFTLVAYMGLYCDRQDERNVIQSILSVGSLTGLLIMNYIADLKGRKKALIIALVVGLVGIICALVGAITKSTTLLVFSSYFYGFSGYSIVIISFIILSDICDQKLRQQGSIFINMFFSLGPFLFFFLYKWCNEWYNIIVLFMLLPMIGLICICLLLIEESPNYLLFNQKDIKGCVDVLTNIAIMNKKNPEQIGEIRSILESEHEVEEDVEKKLGNKEIFKKIKQWKYLKIIICMGIAESGANIFFYGIQFAISDIGFDYGVDNLVMGIDQMAMVVVMTYLVSKLRRVRTMAIVYPLTALISFLFIFFTNPYICTFFVLFIRSLTSVGYFMIVMVQTQSFPLQIQSLGAGSIQSIAQLGSIASPLIIAFAIDNGLNKLASMGVVLLICLIPLKFVPEPVKNAPHEEQQHKQSLLQNEESNRQISS